MYIYTHICMSLSLSLSLCIYIYIYIHIHLSTWVGASHKCFVPDKPSPVYGQFSSFQFARFQIEGLKSQNHCLCSLQIAL